MKIPLILLIILSFITCEAKAQSLIGAWENDFVNQNGDSIRNVLIFADGYYSATSFDANHGKFLQTSGGNWEFKDDTLIQLIEFDSNHPENIGTKVILSTLVMKDKAVIANEKFTRIDAGEPGALQGAWLMSGRVTDGKTQTRNIDTPRKTMKILSGKRFQWIAYDTSTKQFFATGGGTYSTVKGKYTENIEFFSKDDTRVGLSLEFNYQLKEKTWHHTGFSSKGDPIDEYWTVRK